MEDNDAEPLVGVACVADRFDYNSDRPALAGDAEPNIAPGDRPFAGKRLLKGGARDGLERLSEDVKQIEAWCPGRRFEIEAYDNARKANDLMILVDDQMNRRLLVTVCSELLTSLARFKPINNCLPSRPPRLLGLPASFSRLRC